MAYEVKTLETTGTADTAFSPDQRRLYVALSSGDIDVFDVASGTRIATWRVGTALGALSVSEDGGFLLVTDPRQPLLYRVSTASGAVVGTYTGTGGAFRDVEIVDARTAIVTGGTQVTRFDLATGTFGPLANGSYYSSQSVLTEDRHLTLFGETGISNGPLALYDDRSGQIVARGDNYQSINNSGFNYGNQAVSETAGLVLQGIYSNRLNIYDLSLRYLRTVTLGNGFDPINGLTFDVTGRFVYVMFSNGSVVKYDSATFNEVERYALGQSADWNGGTSNYGDQLLVTADGQHLAVISPSAGRLQMISLAPVTAGASGTLELATAGATVSNDATLQAAPAVRVTAANVQLTNTASGRLIGTGDSPAIVLEAAGAVIVNALGGIIRGATADGTAIQGSAGSDTVYNAGAINGAIRLGDGADTFIDAGGQVASLDLGAGDDVLRVIGDAARTIAGVGGDGVDTIVVATGATLYAGTLTGFEKLVVQAGGNLSGFSGFQSIALETTQTVNLIGSTNSGVDLTLAGQWVRLFQSSLRSITGGAGADTVELANGATVAGDVKLGAGDDRVTIDLSFGGVAPIVGGTLDAGAGNDTLAITVGSGGTRAFDLGRATGFETLTVNSGVTFEAAVQVSRLSTATTIVVGNGTAFTLSLSSLPTALVQGAFGGSITLDTGASIGRYGFPANGPYNTSVDLVQGDDRQSVDFVNRGSVAGDVAFYIGDDEYDGRAGSVGGTVYGNAGNDILRGGSGIDRLNGGYGADLLQGNGGADVLTGGAGDDRIEGGAGIDTAVFAGSISASAFRFGGPGIVTVTGADGRDVLVGVERAQFANGTLDLVAAARVAALYVEYGGRDAGGAELAYWTGELAAGRTTPAGVRAAILADPLGRGHTDAVVTDLYQTLGGRTPSAAELGVWRSQVEGGATFADVRSIILRDPLGATAASVIGQYQTYGGRDPSAGELDVWRGLIARGATVNDVRNAILNDPLGTAHTAATVTSLYATYGGRAPSAGEIGVWQGLVKGGATFTDVRNAILDDQLGQTHSAATINGLYQSIFGRAASGDEVTVWKGLIRGGATFDTLADTLLADRGSAATDTQRLTGTAADDVFAVAGGRHAVVSGFDPLHDILTLPGTSVASGSIFDAAHAHAVFALDGTSDVLLTLDNGRDVLLTHVTLDQLSAANVVLG